MEQVADPMGLHSRGLAGVVLPGADHHVAEPACGSAGPNPAPLRTRQNARHELVPQVVDTPLVERILAPSFILRAFGPSRGRRAICGRFHRPNKRAVVFTRRHRPTTPGSAS